MPVRGSKISQGRTAAQPADVIDTLSQRGDVVVGHDPEAVQAYRDAAAVVRQRQESGLPPEGSPVRQAPVAPSEAPLPSPGVARQVAGREIQRLRALAGSGRRELASRYTFGWNGQQISDPAVIAMRTELAAQVEAAEAEAARLDGLGDYETQVWAASQGFR
jgi:hypothetical protein